MNAISFIKRALQGGAGGAVQVADDQPLPTKMIDAATGAGVSFGFTPVPELTTAAGLLVQEGACMLGDITCTKSGSGNSLAVYDGVDSGGTLLATIVGATVGMKFCEGWKFAVGCYIAQSGGTPGSFAPSVQ